MEVSSKEMEAIIGRIISPEQYRDLDPEAKDLYIPYNPGPLDAGMEQLIKLINSNMMIPIIMQPVYELLGKLPDPNPAQILENLLKPINSIFSTLDEIKNLQDVPVIGQLAKPIVDLINQILEVFGGMIALFFLISRGAPIFMDNIEKSGKILKDYMKRKDEKTESAMTAYKNIDWEELAKKSPLVKEFIKTIRPQILDPLETIEETVDTIILLVTVIENMKFTYDDQIKNWEKIFKFCGIKTEYLKIPTEEETMKKLGNSPLKIVKDWNETLEKTLSPRYILKTDNERLRQIRQQQEQEEQEAKRKKEEEAKKKEKEAKNASKSKGISNG